MHARLEGVGAGTKALVGTRDACVAGLVADRVEAPAELTHALAGLLGTRLQDVVVRDVERGVVLLEDLARTRKGRAAIVPLHPGFVAGGGARGPVTTDEAFVVRLADALRFAPEDEALVRALVGDAIVVRDLAGARRLREAGTIAPLVTLDGAVLHADGRVEGGQGDAVAAGMLESKREARELVKELERLDALVTDRLQAFHASRAEIVQAGAALERARHEAHTRELALVTAEKDLQKAEGQLESVARRLQTVVAEDGELTRALDEAGAERDEATARPRGGARAGGADGGRAAGGRAGARGGARAPRRAAAGRDGAEGHRGRRAREARGGPGDGERGSRAAPRSSRERAGRLEDELVANARAFGETAAQLVAHRGEVQAALDRARDAAGRAHASARRVRGAARRAPRARGRAQGPPRRGRCDALEPHDARDGAAREAARARAPARGGRRQVPRRCTCRASSATTTCGPPPDEESRARIEELVRLIERMGSVNLDAMREHAEAEERFTFYTTQKADLDKALADLTRAIQQMNRESRRLFEETFDAVNERFREIFPRMFRGGRAELRLTNPEDMLETGIDIVAQPPGKKLSSIELMSGGEKALTAVSLIFAIFQIKPSPFCILDEVDAPLDEANVARYNELVRSMTDRSQFILITHVKRTMQMVDVLYGVTMPEAGRLQDRQREDQRRHREDRAEPSAGASAGASAPDGGQSRRSGRSGRRGGRRASRCGANRGRLSLVCVRASGALIRQS